jgi:phosphoglycerate dehydrogenase-like enzyme
MATMAQQNLVDLAGMPGFDDLRCTISGRAVCLHGTSKNEAIASYEVAALLVHLRNRGFRVNEVHQGAEWNVIAER